MIVDHRNSSLIAVPPDFVLYWRRQDAAVRSWPAGASLRDNRAECKLIIAAAQPARGRQCAEDRAVRRQLLLGPGGDQGAGALVRHLGRQSAAGANGRRGRHRFPAADRPLEGLRRRHRLPGGDARNRDLGLRACWPRPKRITVFGTVHAPLFHPIIAAKQMVTADHIGEGRFGLNIVVGWNEGEFEMFGVEQREHATRYEYAQEWIDAIKLMWSDARRFRFRRAVHQAEERARQAEALRRHAAGHHERRRVAGRPRLRGEQLRCVLHAVVARLGRGDRAARRRREGRRPRRRAAPSACSPSASSPAGRP